jgi:hypothetical protein
MKQVVLDPWQEEALAHKGNLLLCTGRQVGKTYILSRKAAERMVEKKTKILVASLTEDQAKLIIVMTLTYLEENYRSYICKGKDKPTQNKITLKNGSQILARPVGNSGDALRGFTGDVFIPDEMSKMPQLVWDAGLPTLLTSCNPEIWGASTPFGKQGYFWECFQNKNNFWKVIHISSEDVIFNRPISEAWTEDQRKSAINFLMERKKEMTAKAYGQEFLGLFMEDLQRFFSDAIIDKVCTLKRRSEIIKGNYYLGCDVGGLGGSESTFEILDKISKENIEQVENITTKDQLTTATTENIIQLHDVYDKTKIIGVDDQGIGFGVFSGLMSNPKTRYKTEALNNSSRQLDLGEHPKQKKLLKEDMYNETLRYMEMGYLKLLDDENIKLSLRSVQGEFIIKEKEPTEFRIYGSYTHIIEGIIRALWLISKDKHLNLCIA